MKKYIILLALLTCTVGYAKTVRELSLHRFYEDGTTAPRNYVLVYYADTQLDWWNIPQWNRKIKRRDLSIAGSGYVDLDDQFIIGGGGSFKILDESDDLIDQHEYEYQFVKGSEWNEIGTIFYRNVPEPYLNETFSELAGISPITYNGSTYDADITIVKLGDHEGIRSPVVIVDGFDPENFRDYYSSDEKNAWDNRGIFHLLQGRTRLGEGGPEFMGRVLNNCHDVIVVNWHDGAGNILGNEKLCREIIRWLNRTKEYGELTVIGPSMGGVITRIALAQMEKDGENHDTKLFISFDSPHHGANIPLGIQIASLSLSECKGDQALHDMAKRKLQSYAARQMLLYYYDTTDADKAEPHIDHLLFKAHLAARFGSDNIGWPMNLKKVAISNGAPMISDFSKNDPYLDLDFKILGGLEIYPLGGPYEEVYEYNGLKCDNISADLSGEDYLLLDNTSGGKLDLPLQIQKSLEGNSFLGSVLENTSSYPSHACFIPLLSALGAKLNETNVNPIHQSYLLHPNRTPSSEISILGQTVRWSPFDELKVQATNEEHVTISWETAQWTLDQIESAPIEDILLDPVYNSTSNTVVGNGEFVNHTAVTAVHLSNPSENKTFSIRSGGVHNAVAGQKIHWKPGFVVEKGGYHHSKIVPIGECEKSAFSFPEYEKPSVFDEHVLSFNKEITSELTLFPNPSSGSFTAEIDEQLIQLHRATITISDLSGQTLLSQNMDQVSSVFDLDLKQGVYTVQVSIGEKSYFEKLVIQ